MPRSVWSRPVATGRSTCSCMDVRSFKKTGTGRVYTFEREARLFGPCSVRAASGSVQTSAEDQHQIMRRDAPVSCGGVRRRASLVPCCRTSLTSMTARSRTPAVNSGRSLRCSTNSNNRTVRPQPPRQSSTAIVMRRTSSPSGPTSESIQMLHT